MCGKGAFMNVKPQKLTLNQETLKILLESKDAASQENGARGPHTAVTACSPFSCTLAPC